MSLKLFSLAIFSISFFLRKLLQKSEVNTKNRKLKNITNTLYYLIFSFLYSPHSFAAVFLEKNDIENIAKENNFNDIKSCKNLNHNICYTILGGSHYWGMKFKDKKIEYDDTVAQSYLKSL